VHLLAAYAHEAKLVLDQIPVGAKTNEHKAALELLDVIPLEGKLVIGDAMFCQRDLSRKIRGKKGIGSGR
jgi:predicted transposase YbfD/YdcC